MFWEWVKRLPGIGCLAIIIIIGMAVLMAERNMNTNQVTSQPRGVTLSQYNQLYEGMTYQQAVRILGMEGIEISSNNIGGTRTVMYKWEGVGLGANMNAMFQNGKMIQKAQFGLR